MEKLKNEYSGNPIAARMTEEELQLRLGHADVTEGRQIKSKGFPLFSGAPPIWKSASHAIGFVAEPTGLVSEIPIVDVGAIEPRPDLAGKRVNINLNYLRIAEYPGGGDHRILFDFYAKNQVTDGSEEVHFSTTYRVKQFERAGIKGYPIFVGLGVGAEGLALRCYTVNVKNDDDEKLLSMLDSDVFKSGLKLASTAQPAIGLLSGMAVGLTKAIAGRHQNIPVQDVYLGLDFTRIPGGARLSTGSYLAVQIPEESKLLWDWDKWVFKTVAGQVVEKARPDNLIPFNYFMFGVSEYRV